MLHVDASDVAVVAILTQKYNETDMSICYFSKWLNLRKHNGVFICMRCMPLSRLWASGNVIWSIATQLYTLICFFSTLCHTLS